MSDSVFPPDIPDPNDPLETKEVIETMQVASEAGANNTAEGDVLFESTEMLDLETQSSGGHGRFTEEGQLETEVVDTGETNTETTSRRQRSRSSRGTRTIRRRQSNTELRNLEFEMSLPSTEVLRSMSLRGIYYDRRNHGWQVRIRKRQTEVSRYFSAKRYGVEKSYEMALRFYQINIVGNNLFGDLPSVTIPKLPDPEDDHRCSVCISEEQNMDVIDLSIGALKLQEKIASLANVINSASISTQYINGDTSIDINRIQNLQNGTPARTDLNQIISDSIPNGFVNNTITNQFINNLIRNNLYNMGNMLGFQNGAIPMQNLASIPNATMVFGPNLSSPLNAAFSLIPHVSHNTAPIYSGGPQEPISDAIVRALSDAEGIWRGLSFDNRNDCWYLMTEGSSTLTLFSAKDYGHIDSLILALQHKYSVLNISSYQYYLKGVIGNNVVVLQKFMSIHGHSKTIDKPIQGSECAISRHFKDMSADERLNHFNIDELIVFITISLQLGYLVNTLSLYRSTQTLLAGYSNTQFRHNNFLPSALGTNQSFNNGFNVFSRPMDQGVSLDPYFYSCLLIRNNPIHNNQDSGRK